MPVQTHLLHKAISFYRAGDCETARRLLLGILRVDAGNQAAWIWYAETYPTLPERLAVYEEALGRYPQMRQVERAYRHLRENRVARAAPVAAVADGPAARVPARSPRTAPSPPPEEITRPVARAARRAGRRANPAWALLTALVVLALLASTLFFGLQASVEHQTAAGLRQENARLAANYRLTLADLDQARRNFNDLQGRYDVLAAQHAGLSERYNGLSGQYNTLNAEHLQLTDRYNALTAEHENLARRFADLEQQHTELAGKAVVPPYIRVQQRVVTLAFKKLDGQLLYWSVPFESLEWDIERGFTSRKNLFSAGDELQLAAWDGEIYHVVDFRAYVDPGVFRRVIPDLYAQAGSDEAFIREVWNIVTQLAIYASDREFETPRYPLETLLAGGGDCEDTSILFASMIKAAPTAWQVSLVYLNADHPYDAHDPNHVMVRVDTGAARYLVETTNPRVMTPLPVDKIQGWSFEVQ